MNSQKIGSIIVGVLLVLAGVFCILNPNSIISIAGFIIGILMVISAITKINDWRERKALGFTEKYELSAAILSLVVGLLLLVSNAFKFAISTFAVYILAGWIAISGIFKMLSAKNIRQMDMDLDLFPFNYEAQMRSAIIQIVASIIIFLCPLLITSAVGFIIGFCLMVFGIRQVAIALR